MDKKVCEALGKVVSYLLESNIVERVEINKERVFSNAWSAPQITAYFNSGHDWMSYPFAVEVMDILDSNLTPHDYAQYIAIKIIEKMKEKISPYKIKGSYNE